MKRNKKVLSALMASSMLLGSVGSMTAAASESVKYTEETTADGWVRVMNEGGATLGYSPDSGVSIIEDDGFAFKDLDRDGELDAYEDWRLDYEARAKDLVSKMTLEQMAGLRMNRSDFALDAEQMSSQITGEGIRYIISLGHVFGTASVDAMVDYSNDIQTIAESSDLGIPIVLNGDPSVFYTGGMNFSADAATFDVDEIKELYNEISKIYRSVGITMLLGPQVDLGTDPRTGLTWEFGGTLTEDPLLAADMANAVISAMQSTYDEEGNDLGWGSESVVCQMKHFTGNYSNEGGRNYHAASGSYTVYPGDQFETQLVPFIDGGMNLDSITGQSGAVMLTYTIPYSEDNSYGELVGGAFNKYLVDILREYGFDGMISTDAISPTGEVGLGDEILKLTPAEQVYRMVHNGVDQVMTMSADYTIDDFMQAYERIAEEEGEEAADKNFADAAYVCLLPIFRTGLFESPYLVSEESVAVLNESGLYNNQVNDYAKSSIVMLKNQDNAISENTSDEKKTAYVPYVYNANTATWDLPVALEALEQYYDVVTDTLGEATGEGGTYTENDIIRASAEEVASADIALVIIASPAIGVEYDAETDTWYPRSLQYGEYTADSDAVRKTSIAGNKSTNEATTPYGTVAVEEQENRSYYGQTTIAPNYSDLETVLSTAEIISDQTKLVVCVRSSGAMIFSEFEEYADAILMGFNVDKENFLDIVAGKYEPNGLLPIQMPADMETVESQLEDVPRDVTCYVDGNNNTYDFAFGMNWSGIINDERTDKYSAEAQIGLKTEKIN